MRWKETVKGVELSKYSCKKQWLQNVTNVFCSHVTCLNNILDVSELRDTVDVVDVQKIMAEWYGAILYVKK